MESTEISQLTRVLQLSITPVALMSGVGLILLSMTNRLGRVVDRTRELHKELGPPPVTAEQQAELRILFRRVMLLQYAIALVLTSVFEAVLMVAALFAMFLLGAHLSVVVLVLFGLCLIGLVVATAFFLADIVLSIRLVRFTLRPYVPND